MEDINWPLSIGFVLTVIAFVCSVVLNILSWRDLNFQNKTLSIAGTIFMVANMAMYNPNYQSGLVRYALPIILSLALLLLAIWQLLLDKSKLVSRQKTLKVLVVFVFYANLYGVVQPGLWFRDSQLESAAQLGNVSEMRILLLLGANPNGEELSEGPPKLEMQQILDRRGRPLQKAIDSGNLLAVKLLVDHGANVNQSIDDDYGTGESCPPAIRPPLAEAITHHTMPAVRFLIQKGANINDPLVVQLLQGKIQKSK
jgi:FlaA1/EpsC-like NDP-sugar epimerase